MLVMDSKILLGSDDSDDEVDSEPEGEAKVQAEVQAEASETVVGTRSVFNGRSLICLISYSGTLIFY